MNNKTPEKTPEVAAKLYMLAEQWQDDQRRMDKKGTPTGDVAALVFALASDAVLAVAKTIPNEPMIDQSSDQASEPRAYREDRSTAFLHCKFLHGYAPVRDRQNPGDSIFKGVSILRDLYEEALASAEAARMETKIHKDLNSSLVEKTQAEIAVANEEKERAQRHEKAAEAEARRLVDVIKRIQMALGKPFPSSEILSIINSNVSPSWL